MVCPGKVWCSWLGGIWHGRILYGLFRLGWPGDARPGMARLVLVRHGRRVMVRLGAVLCGSVMYGLVWLAWFVAFGHGAVWHGLAWQAIKGGIIYGLQIKRWCTVENRCPNSR